jgi:transposase
VHGHHILLLPPYHPDLKPTEPIWATIEDWVATKNTTFKLDDAIHLMKEMFSSITPEGWYSRCRHIIAAEAKSFKSERTLQIIN